MNARWWVDRGLVALNLALIAMAVVGLYLKVYAPETFIDRVTDDGRVIVVVEGHEDS